jgi:glycosyltransferase 2 family protein
VTEEQTGELPPHEGRRRRHLLRRLIEIAVTLIVLALALRGIEWQDLWAALRNANYLWLIPGVLVTVALLYLKAWRWQMLFWPEHRLPFSSVMTAMCAGYLGSNVLPGRAGELVRLVLLVSEQPVSVARTLSTIIVERILDFLTMIVVLAIILPFVRLPREMLTAAEAIAIASLAGAGIMVLLSFWKERVLGWARTFLGRIRFLDRPQLYDAIAHLIDGFAALRGRRGLVQVVLSLVAWVGVILMSWSAGQAVPLDLPVTAYAFAVVVTTISMLLPSTPGYIGVFHGAVVLAVAPFGVPKDMALTFALLWHAANYLTLSVSGLVALAVHGVSFGQVRRRLQRGQVETSAPGGAVTKEVS